MTPRTARQGGRVSTRPLWAVLLVLCALLAVLAVDRAWTPAPPPDAGVLPVEQQAGAASVRAAEPTREPSSEPARGDVPRRVAIPALGVAAPVDAVGVQPDGAMRVPPDGRRVGWYRFGPAPGVDTGSAVLAGHVDTRRGGPGALFRLAYVEVGAQVVVTTDDGEQLRYVVTGRQTIRKAALPVAQIFRRDGAHQLVLISCGGPFDPALGRYRDNVVVTAVPADRP